MSGTINKSANSILRGSLNRQRCVQIIKKSDLPIILKFETSKFISRNILPDCGLVPPNCLKAFMIKTAQKMGLQNLVPYVKGLFKSKIGYDGYFLDRGKLCRVELSDY